MADLSESYESLNPSENSICIFNGGQNTFIHKDLEMPLLKEDLVLKSLTMQVEKHFPLHSNSYSVAFRKVYEENAKAIYRLICISKEKWNELVMLCQAAKFGVDAIIPGYVILDKFYKDQLVYFNGKEYEISPKGELKLYEKTSEISPLPFELNNDQINEENLPKFTEALILAKYGLSKEFSKESQWLSPLPKVLKPKRFEKAKKLITLQASILITCLSYYIYLYATKTAEKASEINRTILELEKEADNLANFSKDIFILEDAKEEIIKFNNSSQVDLTEALVELTRLLPENYSIKNLHYNSLNSQITVSVRMENGVATELTDAFRGSSIFNDYPVFNDSGQRLVLTLKSNEGSGE